MKKEVLIIDIISVLFIVPFYYLTKDNNIFLYTLSLSLYLILSSIFNHIDIYSNLKKYYDNNHIYSLNTIYKYTNKSIILINLLISIVIGLISLLFNRLFQIKGLIIVNIIMSLTLFIKPILKNIISFTKVYNFHKLSSTIVNIYKITNLILLIISSIICFRLLDINDYISICILYGCNILSFLLVYLLIYLLVFSNKIKKKQFKKQEERINYKLEIKEILSRNINISIVNIIKYSYFYISIIILYFTLKNKFGYNYIKTSDTINNCYFYAIGIVNLILLIINYFEKNKVQEIKEHIKNKQYNLIRLEDYIINLFKKLLTITLVLSITSDAVWTVLFNNNKGYILFMFGTLSLLYIIYFILVEISIESISNKKLYISLSIGLITKILLSVPLINSLYRIGYNLLYGDMLSNLIAFLIVIILLMINNSKKCKVDFTKKIDKILDIIYYNIILCIILLLLTLIIPVEVTTLFEGIKVIFIYLIVSISYIYLRKKGKNERINNKNRN